MIRCWNSSDRFLWLQMLISFLLTLYATGGISEVEELVFLGLKLKVQQFIFLLGGSFIISLLHYMWLLNEDRSHRFHLELNKLYKELGFKKINEANNLKSPFIDPQSVEAVISHYEEESSRSSIFKVYDSISGYAIMLVLLLILPIGAQVLAAIQTVRILDQNWVISLFALSILVVIGNVISFGLRKY